jgi:hypothetical protein
MRPCRPFLKAVAALAALLAAAGAQRAAAGMVYDFTNSNELGSGNYGTVEVTADPTAGTVSFKVTAATAPYATLGTNFGVDKFFFNTDLGKISSSNIAVYNGSGTALNWNVSYNKTASGFGVFDIEGDASKNNDRQNPILLVVSNLGSNATLDHFLFLSDNPGHGSPSLGNAYFAAHVADFTVSGGKVTSHFVGVQSTTPPAPVPSPPGIVLALSGLLAAGLAGLRRFRRGWTPENRDAGPGCAGGFTPAHHGSKQS